MKYHPLEPCPGRSLYCEVAAAVIGGSIIGAGASIYGANKAAGAQTDTTNAAIANQQAMFGQAKNALDPFIKAGGQGLDWLKGWVDPTSGSNPLASLIKLTTPGADMSETLAQTPGYQFAESRGLRGVNNALAARGLGGSRGAVTKGAGEYVTGLAQNTWQSVVQALQNLFGGGANALQGLVGTGSNAAGALAGNALGTGQAVGSSLIGQGNAQAGAATATGNALGQFGGNLGTAAIIQQLLGKGGGAAPAAAGGGLYGNAATVGAVPYQDTQSLWGAG